ncbi:hypothetical protein RO3G_01419 [Rhizopus delemar RA 99-880]|uniref:Tc1-like transposase DDE domain-containing protein n=1 Tax=Rhizopus delemar (strain RA 99-880 / ATCC MYA-4621 / FGSC 9543 / NRRL 43880) TaxID=246409 RepID=I1BKI5_RHIO9|nr:hypothetical protein RO3G_01419 [Rhizopus delemar RA 99-880]|eukprot:EIE76715.1 hypothetical protein RO3G_01419 [Rhizopus delemar RA 99-880]
MKVHNDLKQSKKKKTYPSEQVQELHDLVIEEGLSARKAGAVVGIAERTAQNYVKTYREDDEKRLPGGRKQRKQLYLQELFLVIPKYVETGFLSGKVMRILNWHKNCVFIDATGFNMHIRRNFGRSKRGMPAKAVIPANRGTTVSIIGAIYEKGAINLTLRKPKAVQKKTNKFLIGVMDTLDQFDMKGRYLAMDNVVIHKVTEVKVLIVSRGYKIIYLPPCSPFLNPIELFWFKPKHENY